MRCSRCALISNGLIIVGVLMLQASAQSEEQWKATIDVAGRQRMLSQKMSKEVLMIALGFGDKATVQSTVNLFDASLRNLIYGNLSLNILAASSPAVVRRFEIVQAEWTTFKANLLGNLDTVRDSNGNVDENVIKKVGTQSIALLAKSNDAVLDLIAFAVVSGASTATDVVNIASRQRMLIQRMAKEVLLVALGFNLQLDIASLKSTSELFGDSHKGIILGAPWAGVTALTKVCTMKQVSSVSVEWAQFKPELDKIVSADSAHQAKTIATNGAQNITMMADSFMAAMVEAVKLFVSDDGTCDSLGGVTTAQWGTLIANVGKQRFLGEKTAQLFMQVVLGVQTQSSRVQLTVETVAAQVHIRTLIEGNPATDSPTAPSQAIMKKLLTAYAAWSELKEELDEIVNTATWDTHSIERVAQLSVEHLNAMNDATDMYVEAAKKYAPSVHSKKIDIAGRQRMLFQKMSVESSFINFQHDVAANWIAFNASVDLWLTTHWDLLEGNLDFNISRTTNVCVVQQMKLAKDQFDLLWSATLNVARGSKTSINDVISINPVAFSRMNLAVGYYSSATTPTCDPVANSVLEWQSELAELGQLRALSQEVASDMYCDLLTTNGSISYLALGSNAVETSLKKLKFGDVDIPAPQTQLLLDSIIALADTWPNFKAKLLANDVEGTMAASLAMLSAVEDVIQQNMASIKDSGINKERMNTMSEQLLLTKRIVKEAAEHALLVRNGSVLQTQSLERLESTMASYSQKHSELSDSAAEIAERTGRTELQAQLATIDSRWFELKAHVEDIAGISTSVTSANPTEKIEPMRRASRSLTQEISAAVLLYAVDDPPDIPEPPPGPPYTLIMFLCIGGFISFICMAACYRAGACQREARAVGNDASKVTSWQSQARTEDKNTDKTTDKKTDKKEGLL